MNREFKTISHDNNDKLKQYYEWLQLKEIKKKKGNRKKFYELNKLSKSLNISGQKEVQSQVEQIKSSVQKEVLNIHTDQEINVDQHQLSIHRKIPEQITPQQLIDFVKVKTPFMKCHNLVKHDLQSKYQEDYTNDIGHIANERLQLDKFSYRCNYPLMYKQSTSKNSYIRYKETPLKSPIISPQTDSIKSKMMFINKDSTYQSNYVNHEAQRSLSMKPAPQLIQLPYLQKLQTVYEKNYDLKYAPYFEPVEKVKKNKNESELQRIIQFDSAHFSNRDSVYKKNYTGLNIPLKQRVSKVDNVSSIIFSPSQSGQYSSEFNREYIAKSLKKSTYETDDDMLQRIAKQIIETKT